MSQSARHHRRKGQQFRTPGNIASGVDAIAKRLRDDPPAVLTTPRQNGRSHADAAAHTFLSTSGNLLGAQAVWEQEQQRLAREAADGLHNDGCECRRCADGPWRR